MTLNVLVAESDRYFEYGRLIFQDEFGEGYIQASNIGRAEELTGRRDFNVAVVSPSSLREAGAKPEQIFAFVNCLRQAGTKVVYLRSEVDFRALGTDGLDERSYDARFDYPYDEDMVLQTVKSLE